MDSSSRGEVGFDSHRASRPANRFMGGSPAGVGSPVKNPVNLGKLVWSRHPDRFESGTFQMNITNIMQCMKASAKAEKSLRLALRALDAGMFDEAVRLRKMGEKINSDVCQFIEAHGPPNKGDLKNV